MKKICIMAVVLLIGMSATALANAPANDDDAWFSNAADDGGLWTTAGNYWRNSAPTSGDVNGVGHDMGDATLRVNSGMGQINVNALFVGVWGPQPWGRAYFSMDSGLLVLAEELMLGYRGYDSGSWIDEFNVVQTWEAWSDGDVTILDGLITVGTTLGIGSTFSSGVGGVGALHIDGGMIRAEALTFGVVDPCIVGGSLSVDIAGGKLLLPGDISSLDARVTAYGGARPLVFTYEADQAGYTTVTPEPATVLLLGLGGLLSLRRKRRA